MSHPPIEAVVAKWHEFDKAEKELTAKLELCRAAKTKVRTMVIAALPAERAKPGEAQAKFITYLEKLFVHGEYNQ